MRFKKYLSIVLSVLMILVCAGCNEILPSAGIEENTVVSSVVEGENTVVSSSDTETSRVTIAPEDYKTIEPPEDGWTLELLNEVTYINGQDIDLPFCLDDLGEDFTAGDIQYSEDGANCTGSIYYKGKKAMIFLSQNVDGEFDSQDRIHYFNIVILDNESQLKINEFITINGVNSDSDVSEVIQKIGKHYKFTENLNDTYSYPIVSDSKTLKFFFRTKNNSNDKAISMLSLNLAEVPDGE
jgi:hypothetical protein